MRNYPAMTVLSTNVPVVSKSPNCATNRYIQTLSFNFVTITAAFYILFLTPSPSFKKYSTFLCNFILDYQLVAISLFKKSDAFFPLAKGF